jgi:hypothetical protein
MKRYRIYVYSGNAKLGIIEYPLPNSRPSQTELNISVDWLINQIDMDFGVNNWTSFEYYKEAAE